MLPASITHTNMSRVVGEMFVKTLFLALITQCLALENCTQEGRKAKNLTIQLQVSQSSEFDFSGYIPAVELALHFINSNSCVLPDYHINVNFTDIIDPQVSRKHCKTQLPLSFCIYMQQHNISVLTYDS